MSATQGGGCPAGGDVGPPFHEVRQDVRRLILAASDLHNVGDAALLLQCAHGLRSLGWD